MFISLVLPDQLRDVASIWNFFELMVFSIYSALQYIFTYKNEKYYKTTIIGQKILHTLLTWNANGILNSFNGKKLVFNLEFMNGRHQKEYILKVKSVNECQYTSAI